MSRPTGGERPADGTCHLTVTVAAMILGALDPADFHRLQRHLPACAACQAEVVLLAPLPGLLNRLRTR
jgi:anti-sigma factor RsiW